MKCPKCNVVLTMSERQGVEIDYCPECRGVWLDRGELDKIIEFSGTAVASRQAPADRLGEPRKQTENRRRYDDDDDDDDSRPGQRGRGGWLSELFEFGD